MEGKDLDGGGLACAVGAQQAKALLPVDSQGKPCHRHLGAIPILALVHLQQPHTHYPSAVTRTFHSKHEFMFAGHLAFPLHGFSSILAFF